MLCFGGQLNGMSNAIEEPFKGILRQVKLFDNVLDEDDFEDLYRINGGQCNEYCNLCPTETAPTCLQEEAGFLARYNFNEPTYTDV